MAKLVLIQDEQRDIYREPIYVYDTEQNKKVTIAENKGLHLQQDFICRQEYLSGTKLLEIDNETKLIIEYEDAFWPKEVESIYAPLFKECEFPYKKSNGTLVNIVSIKDIVKYAKKINVYSTDGRKIFSVSRGTPWEYLVLNFDIKFNNDNFVLVKSHSSYDSIKLDKIVYSYSGKILDKKNKEINAKDLIKKEIDQENLEITK